MPFRSRSILARLARLAPVVLVALALAGAPGRDAAVSAGKLDPLAVATALGAGRASVIVRLVAQADVSAAYRLPGKQARGRFVFERLRSVAERTQPPVVAWLARRGATTRPLFIVNALALEADADTLRALAARPDVAAVRLDGSVSLPEPDAPVLHGPPALSSNDSQPPAASVTALAAVEAGVRAIHADAVWRRGYRGQGIVVAITDTGAAFEHPALEDNYRGRVDGHDYSWYDAISGLAEPVDEANHGTHVTGTAVGKAGSRQIGVAPDAEWIACRLIEEREGPDSASLACLQWALAPTRVDRTDPRPDLAPDVVNASWGGKPGDECAGIPEIAEAVSNLTAAGILFVSSAGNDGDDCGTMCAPATYPASLAVANYDVTHRRIAASSSRGPVQSDIGEIVKPDVAAPGTDINSSLPPTKYGELSGTSMAAPHVTGAAALLLSARPDLRGRPEIVRRILEESADRIAPDRCGPRGDEPMTNHAGYGLIDVDKAVVAALTATPEPTGTSTPTSTATPPHSPTPPATTSPTPTATPLATVTPDVPPTPTDVPRTNVYLPVARRG